MFLWPYRLLTWLLLPWAALHLLLRARRQPEYLQGWAQRFGLQRMPVAQPSIWLHAVSVGETRAAQPLIRALHAAYPHHRLVITHMTPTGRSTSHALFGDDVDHRYLPYDTAWAMQRFFDDVRPDVGIIVETELWPNMIGRAVRGGIPLVLVNGRMSSRSFQRYAAFPRLCRESLRGLSAVSAIAQADADRLNALGAPKAQVFGNIKFDCRPPPEQQALGMRFRAACGGRPVVVAASTREGEEALLADAWRQMMAAQAQIWGDKRPLLVMVPRHPQRFEAVAEILASRGLTLQKRSETLTLSAQTDVWLGDSMGEMFAWYHCADVAIIGGSLLPYGSQNLIEAAAVGTPVLLGPSDYNFSAVAALALAEGAALRVANADSAINSALALLADSAQREAMRSSGLALAQRHAGATQRTVELISRFMPADRRSRGLDAQA
jgi:3-deoxy-D-manno-octulosonic-acid transferase